jgi:hypothetical protein
VAKVCVAKVCAAKLAPAAPCIYKPTLSHSQFDWLVFPKSEDPSEATQQQQQQQQQQ